MHRSKIGLPDHRDRDVCFRANNSGQELTFCHVARGPGRDLTDDLIIPAERRIAAGVASTISPQAYCPMCARTVLNLLAIPSSMILVANGCLDHHAFEIGKCHSLAPRWSRDHRQHETGNAHLGLLTAHDFERIVTERSDGTRAGTVVCCRTPSKRLGSRCPKHVTAGNIGLNKSFPVYAHQRPEDE